MRDQNMTTVARVRSSFHFTRALLATNLRAATASRPVFALQVSFMAMNNLTFFVLWWVLFSRVESIGGWRIDDVEALFGIAAASIGLSEALAGGVRHLGRTIEEGDLDTLLVQPRSVLLQAAGRRSQAAGVGDLLTGVAFLAMSGHLTWATLPVVVAVVLSAATTFFSASVILFSLTFWMRRAEGLSRRIWDVLITLSMYPEPLFGGPVRVVLYTLLPAGFISYLPVRIVRDGSITGLLLLVGVSGVYLLLAIWIFHRGLGRYASGSRFSITG